jgi:hypothetical protein
MKSTSPTGKIMPVATSLIIAGIGAAVSAGAAYENSVAQKKQGQLASQAADTNRRLTEMQNQRAAREAMRKQRIVAGIVANNAATSGTAGSSGELGAEGGLTTQGADNANYMGQTGAAQQGLFDNSKANASLGMDIGTNSMVAGVAGAVGGVANQVFDAQGGYKALFSDSPGPNVSSNPGFKNSDASGNTLF